MPLAQQQHWATTAERRGLLGMRFLLFIYRSLGYRVFHLCLFPTILTFWITAARHRRASQNYLRQLHRYAAANNHPLPKHLNSFRHFFRFGETALEKLAVWRGDPRFKNIPVIASPLFLELSQQRKTGIILGSHLGNFELCRAIGTTIGQTINAIVFTKHARRFNRLLHETAPESRINIIDATTLDAATAIQLKQKIDAGEWLAITADRTAVPTPPKVGRDVPIATSSTEQPPTRQQPSTRTTTATFLGLPADFPEGPFILAAALQCPVFFSATIKENGTNKIYIETFANPLQLPRPTRAESLKTATQTYADLLTRYTLKAPLDWFNFYNFWK